MRIKIMLAFVCLSVTSVVFGETNQYLKFNQISKDAQKFYQPIKEPIMIYSVFTEPVKVACKISASSQVKSSAYSMIRSVATPNKSLDADEEYPEDIEYTFLNGSSVDKFIRSACEGKKTANLKIKSYFVGRDGTDDSVAAAYIISVKLK